MAAFHGFHLETGHSAYGQIPSRRLCADCVEKLAVALGLRLSL
jgi:hypothetical protein